MEGDNNRPIFPLIRDVGDWHESGAHNKWNFSSKHSERGTLIAYQEYTLLLLFYSVEFAMSTRTQNDQVTVKSFVPQQIKLSAWTKFSYQ